MCASWNARTQGGGRPPRGGLRPLLLTRPCSGSPWTSSSNTTSVGLRNLSPHGRVAPGTGGDGKGRGLAERSPQLRVLSSRTLPGSGAPGARPPESPRRPWLTVLRAAGLAHPRGTSGRVHPVSFPSQALTSAFGALTTPLSVYGACTQEDTPLPWTPTHHTPNVRSWVFYPSRHPLEDGVPCLCPSRSSQSWARLGQRGQTHARLLPGLQDWPLPHQPLTSPATTGRPAGLAAHHNHPEALRTLTQCHCSHLCVGEGDAGSAETPRAKGTESRSMSSTAQAPYGPVHKDGCSMGARRSGEWPWPSGRPLVPSLLLDATLVLLSAPNASKHLFPDLQLKSVLLMEIPKHSLNYQWFLQMAGSDPVPFTGNPY